MIPEKDIDPAVKAWIFKRKCDRAMKRINKMRKSRKQKIIAYSKDQMSWYNTVLSMYAQRKKLI